MLAPFCDQFSKSRERPKVLRAAVVERLQSFRKPFKPRVRHKNMATGTGESNRELAGWSSPSKLSSDKATQGKLIRSVASSVTTRNWIVLH